MVVRRASFHNIVRAEIGTIPPKEVRQKSEKLQKQKQQWQW